MYQDCRLPLDIYLECLFDKDYSRLVIKGKPTEDQILEAWEKICVEYSEIQNDGNGNELFQKTLQIQYLSGKITVVDKIIRHLQIAFSPDLIGILKFYGVLSGLTAENWEEPVTRFEKIGKIIANSKLWLTELDLERAAFDKLVGEQTEAKGGVEYFEDWLSSISNWRKYNIKASDISVRQFIKEIKRVEREAIRLQTLNA